MPQTRWLWQLNLAVDPDSEGAFPAHIVLAEENAMRRRHAGSDRRRSSAGSNNEEASVRYQRPRRQNCVATSASALEKRYYATVRDNSYQSHDYTGLIFIYVW